MSGNRNLKGWQKRPKTRWEDDIKGDLRIIKINNWTKCIQD
jgi:hypothetical protein